MNKRSYRKWQQVRVLKRRCREDTNFRIHMAAMPHFLPWGDNNNPTPKDLKAAAAALKDLKRFEFIREVAMNSRRRVYHNHLLRTTKRIAGLEASAQMNELVKKYEAWFGPLYSERNDRMRSFLYSLTRNYHGIISKVSLRAHRYRKLDRASVKAILDNLEPKEKGTSLFMHPRRITLSCAAMQACVVHKIEHLDLDYDIRERPAHEAAIALIAAEVHRLRYQNEVRLPEGELTEQFMELAKHLNSITSDLDKAAIIEICRIAKTDDELPEALDDVNRAFSTL